MLAATLAGWSSPWAFTSAAQISSVTLSFSSTDPSYDDPALFQTSSSGGVPSTEIGFFLQGGSSCTAIASVNVAAPTSVATDADAGIYGTLTARIEGILLGPSMLEWGSLALVVIGLAAGVQATRRRRQNA